MFRDEFRSARTNVRRTTAAETKSRQLDRVLNVTARVISDCDSCGLSRLLRTELHWPLA